MFFDKPVGRAARVALVVALCLLPAAFVARQSTSPGDLTKTLFVGARFLPQALPEFRALQPAVVSTDGYDGQFYAQLAIDPTLSNPELPHAFDLPVYRARRILLPAIARIAGFGSPAAAVCAYALLNLASWYVLLGLLVRLCKPVTYRGWLCICATMLTSGALYSLMRSLVDLPAVTLCVLAGTIAGQGKLAALAAAILTKETYAVTAWALPAQTRWRWAAQVALVLAPFALWALYVQSRMPHAGPATANFGWPFAGWIGRIIADFRAGKMFDGLAASSLLVQFAFLVLHRRTSSFLWRAGMSFAIGAVFLSADPFVNQVSFTRDLLLMTVAFNVALVEMRGRQFGLWFTAGNVGLISGCATLLARIAIP